MYIVALHEEQFSLLFYKTTTTTTKKKHAQFLIKIIESQEFFVNVKLHLFK